MTAGSSGAASSSGSRSERGVEGATAGLAGLAGLARPLNGLMAAAAALVGALVSASPTHWGPAVLGALSAFAAASAANAMNDRLDIEADRVNRPERPIPSGRVGEGAATATAVTCGVVAAGLAVVVGPAAAVLALSWLLLTAVYSLALKGVPVLGNAVVALVAATPFLMGGLTQGSPGPSLIPCGLAFLAHLAREIVKDVEDIEGDRAAGIRTLAVRCGADASLTAARIAVVVLIVLAALPFALQVYGWGYAAAVVVIDVLLVRFLATMGRVKDGSRGPSNLLKGVMALGLAAFILGVL